MICNFSSGQIGQRLSHSTPLRLRFFFTLRLCAKHPVHAKTLRKERLKLAKERTVVSVAKRQSISQFANEQMRENALKLHPLSFAKDAKLK